MSENLLTVDDLSVTFGRHDDATTVVHRISFHVDKGEKLAIVGESGSGKSVTALSILKLHDPGVVSYPTGAIRFQNEDLLKLSEPSMRKIRGRDITVIFQEPMTSLNPVYPIGVQLIEPLVVHQGLSKIAARTKIIELLDRTGIPEPHKRIDAFPHMLSGGQRQRVMIAMALACSPKLLIADEPTTALDVTVQLQILSLIEDLQREFNMAVILITHDLNLVQRFADRICVMQEGKLVEENTAKAVLENPSHPYTKHLLNSRPERLVDEKESAKTKDESEVISGKNIVCAFPIKAGFFRKKVGEIRAVDNISLSVGKAETIGVVGESGSGKTTLGMCLLRLQQCEGQIVFKDQRLDTLRLSALRRMRRHFQVVFQDPYSSLSPRMTVEQIVGEGLQIHFPELTQLQRREKVVQVLEEVGLEGNMMTRYPHEFSGGQRQRIAISRVVILQPKLILLDEPTSALDVSVQKQVLALLRALQLKYGISYIFITHDLNVIRAVAHRIIVMRDGRVVEEGDTETLFSHPKKSYTRDLLQASLFAVE